MKIGICVSHEKRIYRGLWFSQLAKKQRHDWSSEFAEVLKQKEIDFGFVYIDRNDWIRQVEPYDVLIWKPGFMGNISTVAFRDKIYMIEHVMRKRIFPNYNTIWHFESKISQKYLFDYDNIPTPQTFATFDYNEAMDFVTKSFYPLIHKLSMGAASENVKKVKSKKQALWLVNFWFDNFLWKRILNKLFKLDFYVDHFGHIYFQEFVPNNARDLRITVIGDRFAVGFWRNNRKNDFRASGSGLIDYESEIPIEIVSYLIQFNKKWNFDSMAYDIIFKDDQFVVVEMSYGYVDKAICRAKGYFEFNKSGEYLGFREGHISPQSLWIEWAKLQHD